MLAALFMAVLLVITIAFVHLGVAVVARHRAQAAADLAALAAARSLPAGHEQACLQAGALARAMTARMVGCDVDDLDVVVTVEVAVAAAPAALGPARAAARAGPPDS